MSLDPARFLAITFDCYGTLIDWERGIADALRPWLETRATGVDDEAILAAFADAEPRREAERPSAPYREILRAVHGDVARRFGVAPDDNAAAVFTQSVGKWPPFPDTVDALKRLGRGRRLVIVSNVDHVSFAGTRAQLGVEFDAVITAEEVGAYKPDPAMFRAALARLGEMGVARELILHVAQSLYHDHAPAKRLGLATAWVDRRRGRPGHGATPAPPEGVRPDITVASLAELADLLDRAGA